MDNLEERTSNLTLSPRAIKKSNSLETNGRNLYANSANSLLSNMVRSSKDQVLGGAADAGSIIIEEDEEEESSEISASDEDVSWIRWFTALRGNEFFCEVDEEFIQDDFNLTGLSPIVPFYDYALDLILDTEFPPDSNLSDEQHEVIEGAAEILYGLIHARFILTNRGMQAMLLKYQSATFGRCPRVYCQGQSVLPVGLSDVPQGCTVAVCCPRCQDIFHPKSSRQGNIDGAYFGTTFPHLFLLKHSHLIPQRPTQVYVPRVYGFKINKNSIYYTSNRKEIEDEVNGKTSRK